MVAAAAPLLQVRLNRELWLLPPLPGALAHLLEVAHDERAGMEDVARAVALDEVLSVHVLRAANSALLGFRTPAATVQQAVARVGCTTVLSVAVAQAVSHAARLAREVGGVPRVEYWKHTWATATVAAFLSPLAGVKRGEAHLAGLLHDIGKLILASLRPSEYEDCVSEAAESETPLHVVEGRMMGQDHCQAGGATLRAWQMPEPSAEAAENHHREDWPTAAPPVVSLIAVADALAHQAGLGLSGNSAWVSTLGRPSLHPRLTESALQQALQQLQKESRWLEDLAGQFAEE